MQGGLNQVSPAITIPPGMVIDANNFEPSIYGGYSRMKGFERFDGQKSPSDADYFIGSGAISAQVEPGDTIGLIAAADCLVTISYYGK